MHRDCEAADDGLFWLLSLGMSRQYKGGARGREVRPFAGVSRWSVMKRALGLSFAAALLFCAPRAQAQETHKFNAKALAAKFEVPVYPTKGHVVNDEVVESQDDVDHQSSAVYAVKGEMKKALEFLTKAMGQPKEEETDTGVTKYVFKKADPPNSRVRHHVIVTYDKEAKQVQITLWMREYESAADADN